MKKKKIVMISLFTLMLVALVLPESTFAVGTGLTTKATTASDNFFAFVKTISWYIFFPLLIIMFIVKQKAAAQADSGLESIMTKGIWTLITIQALIQWGKEILDFFKALFV
jgi:heme/copper-type cytochrome/quinol oxidase subunit 2